MTFVIFTFIHSFIHTEHLYTASSRELLRGAPDSSTAKKSSLKLRKKTQVTRLHRELSFVNELRLANRFLSIKRI